MTQQFQPPEGGWRRLHPLSPVVRSVRILVLLALVAVEQNAESRGHGVGNDVWIFALVGAFAVWSVVSWLVTRWRLEDATLRIESGLLRRQSLRVPLARLQAVDVVRPLLGRVLGLAELRLRVAGGGRRNGARLAYIAEAEVEPLRAQLLSLGAAAGAQLPGQWAAAPSPWSPAPGAPPSPNTPPSPDTPTASPAAPPTAGAAPPAAPAAGWLVRPLLAVPPGRLVAASLLSLPTLLLFAVLAAAVAIAALAPRAAPGAAGSIVAILLAFGRGVWRPVSTEWGFRADETTDGLVVTCGLLNTRTATIPRGRVQAIRKVEPLLWRPLGWCRVEVDVAGRVGEGRGGEEGGRVTNALLPVGDRRLADAVARWVLPGEWPVPDRPPLRARLKSPLRYHFLAAGHSAAYVVTGSGRLRRVTDVVPLAKVQSLRWVQGPVQRRLRLTTVHVDVAGRATYAVMRDRDDAEAAGLQTELPELCRRARAADTRPRPGMPTPEPSTP